MAGLRAIDRYTLRIRLTSVDYTVLERLAGLAMMAVAREVVEAAGNDIKSQPVGTDRPVYAEGVEARLARRARGESALP
jgi:hypothetical protein